MRFFHAEEMILPDPVRFLTACEYEEVPLGHAMGDELFLALHLIMKGCPDYMKHLQTYHMERETAGEDENLTNLREQKMKKLENYGTVPSPEEIHTIVAECMTATDGHTTYFIHEVRRELNAENVKLIDSQRDNSGVLESISKLKGSYRGQQLRRALFEILKMPASEVGTCFSYHLNDVLMRVAMKQFGIALLVVRDDDKNNNTWPFQTVNYLHECGGGYFLPITFGLIHIENDGNVAILRKQEAREVKREKPMEDCYEGYALEMTKDIRVEGNMIRGLFDVGYSAFADYIVLPQETNDELLQCNLNRPSEYRYATYTYLKQARRAWDMYQEHLQDQERRERRAQEARQNQKASNKGRGAGNTTQSEDSGHRSRGTTDTVRAEFKLDSYKGDDDEGKNRNRTWYQNEYEGLWPSKPDMEDLKCKQMTIDQCLRLLGKSITTKEQCLEFFDKESRNEIIKACSRSYRSTATRVHPDKFTQRVVNAEMLKWNNDRFASLKSALDGLMEWAEIADLREIEKMKEFNDKLEKLTFLQNWECEIRLSGSNETMDFEEYLVGKKQQEERKRKKQQEEEERKQRKKRNMKQT